MKAVHVIAWILLVIGGLNWLLIGLGGWDVVSMLGTGVARVIFVLVGISALVSIFTHKKDCKACMSSTPSAM
jgi:uncharacterized membrane protein YuzA (DUF378 family)